MHFIWSNKSKIKEKMIGNYRLLHHKHSNKQAIVGKSHDHCFDFLFAVRYRFLVVTLFHLLFPFRARNAKRVQCELHSNAIAIGCSLFCFYFCHVGKHSSLNCRPSFAVLRNRPFVCDRGLGLIKIFVQTC